ncbi:outer membrane beta-barrel protein [Microbulbifer sp. SAOS-129_SWC]|uniref:outer membrane beta-barrel protein n=1 Tax=Microbulbifer sp. SAOS-129_SWC TaxID=3145235 RepID=UPI003217F558
MMKWKKNLYFSLAVAFSASASASDLYLRASYGQASTYNNEFFHDYSVEFKDSNAYSITAGYEINPHLSIETTYADLSNYEDSKLNPYRSYDPFAIHDTTLKENTDLDVKTLAFGFLLSTDMNKRYFAGLRAGYQSWRTKWTHSTKEKGTIYYSDPDGNQYPPEAIDDYQSLDYKTSGNHPYYGVIAGWKQHNWRIGIEHTIYMLDTNDSAMSALFISRSF